MEHLLRAYNELFRGHILAMKGSVVYDGWGIDIRTTGISLPSGSLVLGMFVPAVSELILSPMEICDLETGLINRREAVLDRNAFG